MHKFRQERRNARGPTAPPFPRKPWGEPPGWCDSFQIQHINLGAHFKLIPRELPFKYCELVTFLSPTVTLREDSQSEGVTERILLHLRLSVSASPLLRTSSPRTNVASCQNEHPPVPPLAVSDHSLCPPLSFSLCVSQADSQTYAHKIQSHVQHDVQAFSGMKRDCLRTGASPPLSSHSRGSTLGRLQEKRS